MKISQNFAAFSEYMTFKSSVVLKEDVKVELSSFLLQDKVLENSSCYLKGTVPYLGYLPFNMITKHDANLFMVVHASTYILFFLSKNNHGSVLFDRELCFAYGPKSS